MTRLFLVLITAEFLIIPVSGSGQKSTVIDSTMRISLEQALSIAGELNLTMRDADLSISYHQALQKASFDPDKTFISRSWGKLNDPSVVDNEFNISQNIAFPSVYLRKSGLAREQVTGSMLQKEMARNNLNREVKYSWLHVAYLHEIRRMLAEEDSIYSGFVKAAELRHKMGETNRLELSRARSFVMKLKSEIIQNQADIRIARVGLQNILNLDNPVDIDTDTMPIARISQYPSDNFYPEDNPTLTFLRQQIKIEESARLVQRAMMMPNITFETGSLTFRNQTDKRYGIFDIGLAIPLWPKAQIQKIKAAGISVEKARTQRDHFLTNLKSEFSEAIEIVRKHEQNLKYFRDNALPQADLILFTAQEGYKSGEVSYVEYIQSLDQVLEIKNEYLRVVYNYNLALTEFEYLTGKINSKN